MTKFLGNVDLNQSSGNEGGELHLAKPETNSAISGNVVIDVYGDRVRIFESTGTNRGAYIDLTAASTGVGSNLLGGGGATNLDGLSDVVITSPEEFQGLSYNGTSWVNGHIPLVSYVRNAESTTITTGTCVYLYGATGDHATVKRADNTSDTTSSKTIGVAGADITASNNGPIITRGYVDGIDLSTGYAAGDILWLGTNGAFTKTKPTAPDHLVFIGVVVRATNNGIIYVATQNGYELDEIHNVSLPNPQSGEFLKYNGSLWVADAIDLGTDTTGSYVASLVAGTGISLANNSGEGATPTITNSGVTSINTTLTGNVTGVVTTSDTGTVTSTMIADGTIVNGDINASAGIALSKLASGTSGQVVIANGTGVPTYTTISGDITISSTGVATIAADSVALGTDTTGNYMSGISGTSPVSVSHTPGEGSSATVSLASGYGDTQNPYASKTANYFLAAPNGSAGAPTFRAIVAADIPTLNQNTTGTAANITASSNTTLTSLANLATVGTITSGSISASTLTGTINTSRLSGSYTGITGVGTLTTQLYINNSSPTIYLQDSDNRSSMIHCNGNTLYFLRGDGTNSTSWGPYNGQWPLYINLENNDATFGGDVYALYNFRSTGGGTLISNNPSTGSGNSAQWSLVFGVYILVRNTSTLQDKENLQPVSSVMNASMIDDIQIKLWNRKTAPGIPEVGPIAEEMDEVSPFLATRGMDVDDNGDIIKTPVDGINTNSWMSLMTIALQESRSRIATLESKLASMGL